MFDRRRDRSTQPATPEWRVTGWDQPDLTYALAHIRQRGTSWQPYVPALELVPCGEGPKPALFIKVGSAEYVAWTTTVEPTQFVWRWHATSGTASYVLLRLSVYVRNTAGAPIGMAGSGMITVTTREAHDNYGHQLVCSTLFDPGDPQHRDAIRSWGTAPGPTILFFVEENLDRANYLTLHLPLEAKAPALTTLSDAERELSETPQVASGGFLEATSNVKESLPAINWWR